MKKILLSLLAVAALASCSKMNVVYDEPAEIGFSAVAGNITKAGGKTGALSTDQELGIWAFWDNDATVGTVSDFTAYNDNYLVNALFVNKGNSSWGGSPTGYPWPVNGALVFSGYTTQTDAVFPTTGDGTTVSYDFANDIMTFTNYKHSNDFDLCWFGRTSSSYNNRANGTAVPVTLSHALTWISIDVYGEGTPVNNWVITSMTLKNVIDEGTGTCKGNDKTATWVLSTVDDDKSDMSIYSGSHTIQAGSEQTIDGDIVMKGTHLTDNVVIPSLPLELKIDYTFPVGNVTKSDSKTVSLKLNTDNTELWKSGYHYTYTLKFSGNEILVAPSYDEWDTEVGYSVTVE